MKKLTVTVELVDKNSPRDGSMLYVAHDGKTVKQLDDYSDRWTKFSKQDCLDATSFLKGLSWIKPLLENVYNLGFLDGVSSKLDDDDLNTLSNAIINKNNTKTINDYKK